MAVSLAFLTLMYALTFPIEAREAFVYMALLGVAGVTLAFTMVGLRVQMFDFKRFTETILWSALSFGIIYLVNRAVPVRIGIEISPVGETLFAILAGVAEELFFRCWLCTFTFKVTSSVVLAIVVSSGVWTVYHINRYGGSYATLFIIFVAGLVQGWILLQSRMADGPIFGHMLVNWIATSGTAVLGFFAAFQPYLLLLVLPVGLVLVSRIAKS